MRKWENDHKDAVISTETGTWMVAGETSALPGRRRWPYRRRKMRTWPGNRSAAASPRRWLCRCGSWPCTRQCPTNGRRRWRTTRRSGSASSSPCRKSPALRTTLAIIKFVRCQRSCGSETHWNWKLSETRTLLIDGACNGGRRRRRDEALHSGYFWNCWRQRYSSKRAVPIVNLGVWNTSSAVAADVL